MTRGHNIVADGWAGASNPNPYLNPSSTLKHTQKVSKTLVFPLFNSMTSDGPTDGQTKPLMESLCQRLKKGDQILIPTNPFQPYPFQLTILGLLYVEAGY